MSYRAQRFGTSPVGGSAGAVLFILRPGDVRWNVLLSHRLGGVAGAHHTPRTGAARLLCTGIDLTSSIGVCARIQRVLEHIVQGHAIGPAPLERPFGGAFPHADPELDVVLHQRAQEGMPRAELLKLAKDQPDHVLDLGIGIIDHRAGGIVEIANGQRERGAPGAPSARCPDTGVA